MLSPEALAMPARNMKTIQALFAQRGVISRVAASIPKHLTPERLLKVIVSSIAKSPELLECTQQSLLQCAVAMSELGLEPDAVRGLAYLVPFNEKDKATERFVKKCQLIIGYRGFIELARRSGMLRQVEARVVREKDQLDVRFGIEPRFEHIPYLDGDAGKVKLVYCIARFKDGGEHIEMMTVPEVEGIRRRSKQANGKPWKEDWDEMAKKTVMRRAAKWLPLSPELVRAIEVDDEQFVEGSVSSAPALSAPQRPALSSDNGIMAMDALDAVFASAEPAPPHDPVTGEVLEESAQEPVSSDAPAELTEEEKAIAADAAAVSEALQKAVGKRERLALVPRIKGLPEPERSEVMALYEKLNVSAGGEQ